VARRRPGSHHLYHALAADARPQYLVSRFDQFFQISSGIKKALLIVGLSSISTTPQVTTPSCPERRKECVVAHRPGPVGKTPSARFWPWRKLATLAEPVTKSSRYPDDLHREQRLGNLVVLHHRVLSLR